jgi:UDP-N-acetylglucosamine--N-acetylmuramyl-(pentapeptide) pyrophosphoryl-undecaprenol N-acetylglucosamine transferase
MKKILFTGAHHNSALALLDWMKENSSEPLGFIWVGRKYAPGTRNLTAEYNEVSSRNIPFYHITAGKLYRFSNPKFVFPFLKNLALVPMGFFTALRVILAARPDLIISFGGYIGVPVTFVGKMLKIKCVSHEQTLSIGLANRISYHFVDTVYTAWPISNYPQAYRSKMKFVGLPLKRQFIEDINSNEKIAFKDSKPVIYITGGKNGSHTLNKVILESLDALAADFNLIWGCGVLPGEYDYKNINKIIVEKDLSEKVLLREYFGEHEVAKVFNTADLAISRSGAHTVYELIFTKTPAILIPIPWSSNNEQYKNAAMLEKAGLGVIIEEEDLCPEGLLDTVNAIKERKFNKDIKINYQVNNNSAEEMGHDILQSL